MPTTSNFGWTTPADTDLVKDGAAAIRTLGNGIDTSLVDLKGGTTGQNLRKASNTDLDFTFAGDATNTVVDAAGDLLYGTAADTLGRLAIGTAGQVLKVNSGATAPEWATATAATFAGCRVVLTTTQSIANNTLQAIAFTSETFDTDGYHSNVTNTSRLTIPSGKQGYYQIDANITWAANGTGIRDWSIYKNGSRETYFAENPQSTGDLSMAMSTILYGAATDYFEIFVFQNSGGALNLNSPGTGAVSFSIGFLGA